MKAGLFLQSGLDSVVCIPSNSLQGLPARNAHELVSWQGGAVAAQNILDVKHNVRYA